MDSTERSRRLVVVGLSIACCLVVLSFLARQGFMAEKLASSAGGLIRFYQQSIHPVTKHHVRCRLQPTCSNFALRQFRTKPFLDSLGSLAQRLALCARAPRGAVGLMDLVGSLPKAETLVGADEPRTQQRTSSRIVECPPPKAHGRENADVPRVGPETSEKDRIRQIERYASQQLAAFLAQEQRAQSQSQTSAGGWDLWSAICVAAQATQRFVAVGARMAKVAAVCLLVLAVFSIIGLHIYANRTLGTLVDSAGARITDRLTWSSRAVPAPGRWRVDLRTDSSQLVARESFVVR